MMMMMSNWLENAWIGRSKVSGEKMPWLNGDYKLDTELIGCINHAIVHVDNDLISLRYLKFLDSEADAEKHAMSWEKKSNNSVMITFRGETAEEKISEDKKTITGAPGSLDFGSMIMTWITPEEAITGQ